jgi:hypothetical protein
MLTCRFASGKLKVAVMRRWVLQMRNSQYLRSQALAKYALAGIFPEADPLYDEHLETLCKEKLI